LIDISVPKDITRLDAIFAARLSWDTLFANSHREESSWRSGRSSHEKLLPLENGALPPQRHWLTFCLYMIKCLIYAMRTRTMRNAGNAHNLQW